MGMRQHSLDELEVVRTALGQPWHELAVCEFGEQSLVLPERLGERYRARDWFAEQGVQRVVSLDLRGVTTDAIPFDLSKPLHRRSRWHGHFDLVTNFGTIEHVEDDYVAFYNADCLLRDGGIVVHNLPLVGSWRRHGHYTYPRSFPLCLTAPCGYDLLFDHLVAGQQPNRELIACAFRKRRPHDAPFIDRDRFVACRHAQNVEGD